MFLIRKNNNNEMKSCNKIIMKSVSTQNIVTKSNSDEIKLYNLIYSEVWCEGVFYQF